MKNKLKPFKGKLGLTRAKHLLRRATYGIDISGIEKFAKLTANEAVEVLFDFEDKYPNEPTDFLTGQPFVDLYRGKPFKRRRNKGNKIGRLHKYTVGWWTNEAIKDKTIKSKLVFFLHTCFSIRYIQSEGIQPHHFYDHLQLFAKYANKSYKELAYEMVVDNAMLEFLDNYTNSKENPNENFAREFLELFTIGKGEQVGLGNYSTYTEQDVITAAKLLTGFVKGPLRLNRKKEVVDKVIKTTPCRGTIKFPKHDTSNKKFSEAFNNKEIKGAESKQDMWRELHDFVDMIFASDATAFNICRKIYRYFIYREIDADVEEYIIKPLAELLIEQDYNIAPVVKKLLKSEHFLGASNEEESPKFVGAIIKSPLDLTLTVLSFFKIKTPDINKEKEKYYEFWFIEGLLFNVLIKSGFHPFAPQDVAGYPSYYQSPNFQRGWFSSSSIIGRYSFIQNLLREKEDGKDFGGTSLDLVLFIRSYIKRPEDAKNLIVQLTKYLFPVPLDQDRFNYFLNQVLLDDLGLKNWKKEWKNYLNSNDATAVKKPLNRLLVALVNAPEFQVM